MILHLTFLLIFTEIKNKKKIEQEEEWGPSVLFGGSVWTLLDVFVRQELLDSKIRTDPMCEVRIQRKDRIINVFLKDLITIQYNYA
jgi:hypothetical protein